MMDINLRELAGEPVDFQAALEQSLVGKDLFIVTLMDEFARQPELQKYMDSNYRIIKDTPEIIIYDLNEKL